jgi:nucleoside-diphosphate-sugar epimerase
LLPLRAVARVQVLIVINDQKSIMYYNIISNQHAFAKFINFSSGAEIYAPNTPYGLSKKIITQSILQKDNFFNIRIFATFCSLEKETRFIKASINNYINNKPIIIHQNKKMDFFSMKDLLDLVAMYLQLKKPPKTIDCTYKHTKTLLQIAKYINTLDNHKVKIVIKNKGLKKYCGTYTPFLKYRGLEQSIQEMYNDLKNK